MRHNNRGRCDVVLELCVLSALGCAGQGGSERTCPDAPAPEGVRVSDTAVGCSGDTALDSDVCELRCTDPEVCPDGRGHYCVDCGELRAWWSEECGVGKCFSDWRGDILVADCEWAK